MWPFRKKHNLEVDQKEYAPRINKSHLVFRQPETRELPHEHLVGNADLVATVYGENKQQVIKMYKFNLDPFDYNFFILSPRYKAKVVFHRELYRFLEEIFLKEGE